MTPDLLHHGPVEARVSRMDPGDVQVLLDGALVELPDPFEGYRGRLDDLRVRPRVLQDALVDEAPGPDDDVRLPDEARAPDRQQVGRARARPDKPDLTQEAPSFL